MDLTVFFKEQGIDVFAEVSLDNLSDEDRASVVQFFPAARSVIVFGREVPVPVYQMPPKEKTRGMLRIAEVLDNTAARLASCLEKEQVPARPVPLYLPVRIAGGKVQGVVRLKQVAAAGGLGSPGKNTVLYNPRFGPRLLLSGVVTGRHVQESGQAKSRSRKTGNPGLHGMRTLHQSMPGGSTGAGRRRCVPVPDRECLGSTLPCPGSEVDVGPDIIIEMHRPACTVDRPDGNDPVQPLCHGVPEFFRRHERKGEGAFLKFFWEP